MDQISDVILGSSPDTTVQDPPGGGDPPTDPVTPVVPPKGFVPLQALHEERTRRQEMEAELERLRSLVPPDGEIQSEEGRVLAGQIGVLQQQLSSLQSESAKKDLIIAHPVLKEKWSDFESFRALPENKGMNLRTAAKAFLAENGLLDRRPGLEKPTGGPRVPIQQGMSAEDVENLRKNDFRKYQEMLLKGQIKIT